MTQDDENGDEFDADAALDDYFLGGGAADFEVIRDRQPKVFPDPIYTTRDRDDAIRIDYQRTRTAEQSLKTIATRRRPRLERDAWRGFRVVPWDMDTWKALPIEIKYHPVVIDPAEKRTTGSPWERDINPPRKKEVEVIRWNPDTKQREKATEIHTIKHPRVPKGKKLVWRPVILYTPDANPTRTDSRQFNGFGLIPKDAVEKRVDEIARLEGLDQYQNKPYAQVPPNVCWRLRQIYAEARVDVYFGPRDPSWPGGRRWREGYANFANAYRRFRQYIDEKRADGWSNSKIYNSNNVFEEFFQLVYSEWGQFWRLIENLAHQADPESGLQDPWLSVQAIEDIADLFSVRPPVSTTKTFNEEGELVRVGIDRANPRSIWSTKYDGEALGKWVEGNNAALAIYQNADLAQVAKGTAQEARNKWLGGASYTHYMRCLRLRLSYDIRVFNGEPLVREMLSDTGVEPRTEEYIGSDHWRVKASKVNLPPFTELWSMFPKFHTDLGDSRQSLDDIVERLIKKGQLRHSDIEKKHGDSLIDWQKDMVWVWADPDGHWGAWPTDPSNAWNNLVSVFPREYWPAYLDYFGAARSEHYRYRTWASRLQQNMARAGITDDLYPITPFNIFKHEEIAVALWLYQSAANLGYKLGRVKTEAWRNRKTDYLEDILDATEDLPGDEEGREDMEAQIQRYRSDAFEWFLRRKAEFYFCGFARIVEIKAPFSKGSPWRLGDDTLSWKLLGKHGLHIYKRSVYDAFQGMGEAKDDPRLLVTTPKINEWRISGFLSRRFSWLFWNKKKPPVDGHTAHALRTDIMDWLLTWADIPMPGDKEWHEQEPAGFSGHIAEWILNEISWWDVGQVLYLNGCTWQQMRRVWYCYAPINNIPLD